MEWTVELVDVGNRSCVPVTDGQWVQLSRALGHLFIDLDVCIAYAKL